MRRLALGVFLVLHGLVHVWYVVLSHGWVEVEDQMGWNGHSWLLSSVLSADTILAVASVLYVAVTLGFVAGGVGYALSSGWATGLLVGTALLSTVVLVAMWDGRFDLLVEKGVVGVLINLALVAWLVAQ
ncbi:hypothetical protein [Haloglomus litoreum]|uniref:hypothetical protein n=1 Tax=Haloglomus litoreum TaxID=3034026 RepID=UPI0023E835BF|nr:hypothetical protein [Haloglomus sp. DT116]